jgi:hypothetical protein
MKNFFYVVYPSNQYLRDVLNILKAFADNNQRSEAHITIRGPYNKKKLSNNDIDRWSNMINGEEIRIINTDNFFAYDQNTVFYNCGENLMLKKVWKKFTYNEFRPHITIYNGNDRQYSYKIFELLARNFSPFSYQIEKLTWLEPKDDSKLKLFHLLNIINHDLLKEIIGKSLNKNEINELSNTARLDYMKEIIQFLNITFGKRTIANNI